MQAFGRDVFGTLDLDGQASDAEFLQGGDTARKGTHLFQSPSSGLRVPRAAFRAGHRTSVDLPEPAGPRRCSRSVPASACSTLTVAAPGAGSPIA
ncbi:hypothetical protein GCM10010331_14770 [Streptomyces xanthochromogenes]|nr:hypothetical protein GCM10010331_14770 [Streptomyces xanthochromogenes]